MNIQLPTVLQFLWPNPVRFKSIYRIVRHLAKELERKRAEEARRYMKG